MTKTHLESRIITSADAGGVTSHISHRRLLYDRDFNLGVEHWAVLRLLRTAEGLKKKKKKNDTA